MAITEYEDKIRKLLIERIILTLFMTYWLFMAKFPRQPLLSCAKAAIISPRSQVRFI